jgi:site-specific recombinase XerD
MAARGQVSVRRLRAWMGHARMSTTEIYADFVPVQEV